MQQLSVTSSFLITGRPDLPLVYAVETPELASWLVDPLRHQLAPAVDVPCWIEFAEKKGIPPTYAGVEIRKVDMAASNRPRPSHEHRKVQIYRPDGRLPADEQLTLSICAHIVSPSNLTRTCLPLTHPAPNQYASDRNGLFAITGPHNRSGDIVHTGSLSHTLIFHAGPNALTFTSPPADDDSTTTWAVLEQFSDSASEGRGLVRARMWSADGTLLATVLQDAVVRVRVDDSDAAGAAAGKSGRRTRTFSEVLKSML
ncbi:hypothetical protein DRE_01821 [Drechslerella stenobrocha 248]|uniref:Acyl-CoA thioesterase-like C-terminal domain-containing protein n=1 Tax=Drechslerella stenobrocha 248 TaxID=1043628 RepID=W7HYM8_9PEZI|nr:hypothetical protein DRE_01821 [Drechslerella stenobrocha 248]